MYYPALRNSKYSNIPKKTRDLYIKYSYDKLNFNYYNTLIKCNFILRYYFHCNIYTNSNHNTLVSMDGSRYNLYGLNPVQLVLNTINIIKSMYYGNKEYEDFINDL